MSRRTAKEIENEIAALAACKAYVPRYTTYVPRYTKFMDDNHAGIDLQIEYLRGDIDTTSGEFDEFNEHEQAGIQEAEGWALGNISESPSAGWDSFKPVVKKTAPKKPKK